MTAPLLEVDGLVAGYGGRPALEDVSFALAPGERIGILGPNGGGKTTLFRVLLGELPALRGRVVVSGACGYVPQTERSRLDYPVSALDVALMGTLSRLPWWRRPGRAERAFALRTLERVQLAHRAQRSFGELSGGQRQRVLIARALVQDAPILLFDEPFTGLDEPSAEHLEELIAGLAAEGRGIMIASHDLERATGWDRVLCLNRRQIAFGEPEAALTRSVLEQTYGGDVVSLPGEVGTVVLPPHHHDHDHDH